LPPWWRSRVGKPACRQAGPPALSSRNASCTAPTWPAAGRPRAWWEIAAWSIVTTAGCAGRASPTRICSCKTCGRDFCYRCGDCGSATCHRCRKPSPAPTPGDRPGDLPDR
jgi:hypothetical protein